MSNREFTLANAYTYNQSGPVRWILSHTLRYPWFLPGPLVGAILNNLLYSYIQVYIGRAFDLISNGGWQARAMLALALGTLAFAIGQGLAAMLRNYTLEFLAQRVERDAREELYASLLGKSQTFHGRQRIGDVMARVTNDVHMLNFMFSPGIMLVMDAGIGIIVPVVMIGILRLDLLLVPAIFLALFAVTLIDYNRKMNPVADALREQFGTMNAGLTEAIAGIEIVKATAQEGAEWQRFVGQARRYRDVFVKQGLVEARYLPTLIFSVAWGGGLLHSLLLWRAGALTLGGVVTFMGLLGTLRFATWTSLFSFNLVQLGIASAGRILEILRAETELDENVAGVNRPIRGEVAFDDVSFGYEQAPILKGISFSVQPGETVAIVGQTGTGKTTLTRLINRIFDAGSGRVLVDGLDVRDWNLESLRSQISVIEQDVFLFSRSIADNIAFGCPQATPAQIEAAAREAQAHEFIMSFSEGYKTEVGERGVTLSGGQRQRIAIARAFLTDPRILILDDSTSAIDSATEDQIQRAMRRISSQRTTFLITHRLSQIRWADRILVLRGGSLVDQGRHEELLERSADYRRIFARYDE